MSLRLTLYAFFAISILHPINLYAGNGHWGLSQEFIVSTCNTKAVGPCEHFRGRSNQTNGAAAVIIWKVGTKRIVSWGAATKAANDVIAGMGFNKTLYADFKACPMEKNISAHRIQYCVEEVKNIRWKTSPYDK